MTTLIAPAGPPAFPSGPLLTAEEFVARYDHHHVELVKGVVKEVPVPGFDHGIACSAITFFLNEHVRKHNLGRVVCNDTYVKTRSGPDSVRGMDVGYFSFVRLPKGTALPGLPGVSAELVMEVRSPSDTWTEMFAKVGEYLGAGVNVVVVLDPETRTASVYRPTTLQEILRAEDTLTVPDVLPGFAVAVASLFE